MTVDDIRAHAKENGLPQKRIDELIALLHPDETGKLSLEESLQAVATINYIADVRASTKTMLEAVKATRNRAGNNTDKD